MKKIFTILLIEIVLIFSFVSVALPENIKENYLIFNISEEKINTVNGPQEEWNKTYGGELNDFFRSGIELDNGNYVINGVYGVTADNTESDWWLVCIDSNGELLWYKTYGASGYCNGLLLAPDGGYVLIGSTIVYGSGGMDIMLAKTDEYGNIEWSQIYGGPFHESAHSVQMTDDGGYIITGWTMSFGDELGDLWLIKTDNFGNELWSRTFGGTGIDGGDHIIPLDDGGYMCIGVTTSFGTGGFDVWLLKTDLDGNEIWNDTLGNEYDDFVNDFKKTFDEGYILVGNSQFSENNEDIWLLKFDSDWNLKWNKMIGDENYNELGLGIQQTSDNGFIVTGSHRSSFITGNQQGILLKVDSNGNEEWRTLFGGSAEDLGDDILISTDGGYIVFGYSVSYGAGYKDGWFVKFSAFENQRPYKPSRPSGRINGKTGVEYIYTTSTTDPDGDDVFYLFDWGDGSTSFILGPYESGAECSASGIWFEEGSYEIKVKAIDENDAESDWSDPLVVSMPKNKILYRFPFLCRFLEQYPLLFPFLRQRLKI